MNVFCHILRRETKRKQLIRVICVNQSTRSQLISIVRITKKEQKLKQLIVNAKTLDIQHMITILHKETHVVILNDTIHTCTY